MMFFKKKDKRLAELEEAVNNANHLMQKTDEVLARGDEQELIKFSQEIVKTRGALLGKAQNLVMAGCDEVKINKIAARFNSSPVKKLTKHFEKEQ
jgi:hypothetical protein